MTAGATAAFQVEFRHAGRPRAVTSPPTRTPRVARLLALAHNIDQQIRAGFYDDLADAAWKLGLTRARVTQIVNLTLLAPEIQQAILALPTVTKGRDPITERTLRPIVAEIVWGKQLALWATLKRLTQGDSDVGAGAS